MTIRSFSIVIDYDDEVTSKETLHDLVADQDGVTATGIDYNPYEVGKF